MRYDILPVWLWLICGSYTIKLYIRYTGACAAGDQVPAVAGQAAEGDAGRQGGAAQEPQGGQGQDTAGPGAHEQGQLDTDIRLHVTISHWFNLNVLRPNNTL